MKILFDAQPLLGNRSGIGRYVDKLTYYLNKDSEIDLFYWFNQLIKKRHEGLQLPNPKIRNSRYPYKVIRRLMGPNWLYQLPIDWLESFDVFHGGNFITCNTKRAKNIITIHDLAFLRFPEVTSDKIYKHHTRWLPYSIQLADHIITDSYQSKQDIIDFYKVHDTKISVVHLAADEDMGPADKRQINDVQNTYRLPSEYVLYVGTIEPRKNIPFLIESFARAKKKYKFDHKLVIVGGKGWKYEAVNMMIEKWKVESDVIFTGYVADQDLPAIYSGATLFLFPSVFEGFGLPVLEAMQCGVPVITSNISSLPEVVGGAGRLLPIGQAHDWADSIGELLGDQKKLQHYRDMGFKQSKQFSWEKVAEETINVYRGA
jgi:glycosyltransferase involved in cell wall biosynthesis